MVTLRRKCIAEILLVILLSTGLTFAYADAHADGATVGPQTIARMIEQNRSNARNEAILQIAGLTSPSDVRNAVGVLESHIGANPNDRYAEMYYGYGLLFLAGEYLKSKNYIKAAEVSKEGFFYIDEAAESSPDDWRLRYLRTRMDAFVPAGNGRCVVALKDIDYMTQSGKVPQSLDTMISMMKARSQKSCSVADHAAPEQTKESDRATVPFLMPAEISAVLQAVVGGGV
jgi:hypothetical protein